MIKQEDIQLNVRHAIETQIYTVVCSFYVTRRHRHLAVSHSSGVLGSVTCYFHVPDVFFSSFLFFLFLNLCMPAHWHPSPSPPSHHYSCFLSRWGSAWWLLHGQLDEMCQWSCYFFFFWFVSFVGGELSITIINVIIMIILSSIATKVNGGA